MRFTPTENATYRFHYWRIPLFCVRCSPNISSILDIFNSQCTSSLTNTLAYSTNSQRHTPLGLAPECGHAYTRAEANSHSTDVAASSLSAHCVNFTWELSWCVGCHCACCVRQNKEAVWIRWTWSKMPCSFFKPPFLFAFWLRCRNLLRLSAHKLVIQRKSRKVTGF